ncbi:MAG: hypothetical protein CO119_11800 [Flavobacteriales bacterium CG_4_9_14_3_um_filter_40_17]|nr:MAG: hypothetical protein CO119_11800 [Flavobacteriales bacterium CG_4_9_14_3_um_filter_40_17]
MLKSAHITLFLLFFFSIGLAQRTDETAPVAIQKIETSDLEKFQNDPKFNYTEVVAENWLTLSKEWVKRGFYRILKYIFGNKISESTLARIFEILPYVAAIALLLVIVMLIIKGKISPLTADLSNPNAFAYTEDEALLNHPDLDGLVAEAIQNKDYRKALRFSYLKCIKSLAEQHQIDWQPDKTNTDYTRELQTIELRPEFINITRWYNRVWFGNFPVEADQFSELQVSFDKFQNTMNPKK